MLERPQDIGPSGGIKGRSNSRNKHQRASQGAYDQLKRLLRNEGPSFISGKEKTMITRRFKEPRGLSENTPFYGLYVRVSGDSRELLKQAQDIAAKKLGATPSNPVLLDELLRTYVREAGNV